MDTAVINGQREGFSRLENGEMSGAANTDFASAIERQQRVARRHRDVAAAGDHGRAGIGFQSTSSRRFHQDAVALDAAHDGRRDLRGGGNANEGQNPENEKRCGGGRPKQRPWLENDS
jgi:hypothetical protein